MPKSKKSARRTKRTLLPLKALKLQRSVIALAALVVLGVATVAIFAVSGSYTITAYSPRGGSDWREVADSRHPCRYEDDGRVTYTAKTSITLTCPVEGVTAAVDTRQIPGRSNICIAGVGSRVAQDRGSAIQGKRVDVFFTSQTAANNFGRKYLVSVASGVCVTLAGNPTPPPPGPAQPSGTTNPYTCDHAVTRFNDRNDCVKHLQYYLSRTGAYDNRKAEKIRADGIFGKNTLKAVRSYQTRKRLLTNGGIDGIVGPDTWTSLHGACQFINAHPKKRLRC